MLNGETVQLWRDASWALWERYADGHLPRHLINEIEYIIDLLEARLRDQCFPPGDPSHYHWSPKR